LNETKKAKMSIEKAITLKKSRTTLSDEDIMELKKNFKILKSNTSNSEQFKLTNYYKELYELLVDSEDASDRS
jgi:hypothetical protein